VKRSTEEYRPDAPIVAEIAAGVVIVQRGEGTVFLLHQADEDRWCLPKGHVDPGESLATAALREVREETGFRDVVLRGEVAEVTYRFYQPRRELNVHKTVVYFLGDTAEHEPRLEPLFDRSEWCAVDAAERKVAYAVDRAVLSAARVRLSLGSKK
jgi:8-oxo-(d)GTP phosphatase